MNAKVLQTNHESIGQHPTHLKGETMNTKMINDSRKRFLSLTAAGLISAVMSHAALADIVGPVNVSPNGRIATLDCYSTNRHIGSFTANQPVKFKIIKRDYPDQDRGVDVFTWEGTAFSYSSYEPGYYVVAARNIQATSSIIVLNSQCS